MRALPFLAALLCTAPLANAKTSDLELLQSRCAEMERQIRALEAENSQLKSQANLSTKTVIETAKSAEHTEAPATPATKPTATEQPAAKPAATSPSYATVRAGDTLTKIAKRNGTTSDKLVKLNKIKNPSALQVGQKLRLPDKAPAAVAKTTKSDKAETKTTSPAPAATAAIPQGGTHIVKSGETFYSIARTYGLSDEALKKANPQIKPESLRAGQTLHLGAKAKSESAPATAKSKPTSETKPATEKESAPAVSAPKTAAATPSTSETTSAPAPVAETASQAVASGPKLRLVVVDAPIDFGTFAANHGTSTARLNALNGHDLKPSTLIDKGS
ncbi:MAG TPA: LysM peptidoglycan-binding domain-containing protein, partial [Haloferula sp.]